jgi:TRAP-type C4-dicarboxylate transport system permease small subunit
MKSIEKRILKLVEIITVILLILLVLLTAFQVIFRFIKVSAPWTEELARFCYIYVTFFGSVLLIKESGHIVIDFMLNRLSKNKRRMMETFINVIIIIFLAIAIYGGINTLKVNSVVSAASLKWFKMNYVYGGVILGFILMFVFQIANIIKSICMNKKEGYNND